MPKSHVPYPPEFKRRLVELVRAGRTPEELAEKFEPTARSIRNWVVQADRDGGHRQDGLTTEEREAATLTGGRGRNAAVAPSRPGCARTVRRAGTTSGRTNAPRTSRRIFGPCATCACAPELSLAAFPAEPPEQAPGSQHSESA